MSEQTKDTLKEELQAKKNNFNETAPDKIKTIYEAGIEDVKTTA